jgi:exosome complex RNA-binding protein Csl4
MMRHYKYFTWAILSLFSIPLYVWAQDSPPAAPKSRTIVAEILMIDGDFYVVRGERGEIRIEVTPDTKLSQPFQFGDRIKAVVLPNDVAISIDRAGETEALGVTTQQSTPVPIAPKSGAQESAQKARVGGLSAPDESPPSLSEERASPRIRIVVADILMVDGDFYVVRSERGEIRIEVTPDTKSDEIFKFGDRIKAHILPNDKAISVQRAEPGEPTGIVTAERVQKHKRSRASVSPSQTSSPDEPLSESDLVSKAPKTRIIIAELLMIDGDFYVVRGDRGEIRIEVTPDTKLSEVFKFGDKIKARILPTDEAISVERAKPDEPIGTTEPQ